MIWQCRQHRLDLAHSGAIMGILNVTPDSFSDGGHFTDPDRAVAHALHMVQDGAAIIDIGGESTRPGAAAVSVAEEIARVIPVITALRARTSCLISIDTMKAETAAAACEAGADIINDVSGLRDPQMAAVAADYAAGLVIMHMQGEPLTMQVAPQYTDVVTEVAAALTASVDLALSAGVDLACIVTDPGIGFGKSVEQNLAILRQLNAFAIHGRPVLLGASRKSIFAKVLGTIPPDIRDAPTIALTAWARSQGCKLHRVHNVKHCADALRMVEAIDSPSAIRP